MMPPWRVSLAFDPRGRLTSCAIVAVCVAFMGAAFAAPALAQTAAAIDSLVEAERYEEAIPLLERELTRAAPDSAVVELRSTLMLCRFQLGDFPAARREQERVVELRTKMGGPADPQLADDLNDLAMICDKSGDDDGAAVAWRRSLTILRTTSPDDAARIVPRTSALAEAERRLGHIDESERLMRDAIAMSERALPRNFRHARLLNNLGALEWDQRRFDEASRDLREALRISEADSTSTPLRIGVAHHNLANLKREQGDWEESERLHLRALAIARDKLTDDPQFPIFLKELAVLYSHQGRDKEAFALWDEALAALRKSPQKLLESEILYERGRARLERGELAAADSSLGACRAIREKERAANHPMIGQVLAAQGSLEAQRGNGAAARRDLERAATILDASSIYPEERVEAHQGIARLDWSDGRRPEAVERMSRSLDMIEDIRTHRSASDLSRTDWVRRTADATYTMVGWLVDLGRLDQAIAVGERIRGRLLSDQLASAHVNWRRGVAPEKRASLDAKERAAEARIRGLRRDLEATYAAADESKAPAIEKKLRAAVAEYRDVQEQMRAESPAWSKAMSTAPSARIVQDAQKKLGTRDLVLAYSVGPERSFVFDIPAKGTVTCTELRVPADVAAAWAVPGGALTEAALESIVQQGRGPAPREIETTSVRGVGTAGPASGKNRPAPTERQRDLARLSEMLVPPATRQRVLAATRVHLLPDGPLHDLPFEALVMDGAAATSAAGDAGADKVASSSSAGGAAGGTFPPGGGTGAGAPGEDWLAHGPLVSYGHSLSTFVEIASRPRSVPAGSIVLTVSDPESGDRSDVKPEPAPSELAPGARTGRWKPLPGTRRESDAIEGAFSRETVVRLTGADAREARVKELAPRARILHFGTHGFVERERNDLLAALVLAKEPREGTEDGFLHLFEVYELRLASDLVVLSACETQRGERVRGEGVFALSRGFFAAGARQVVASLWPVDDDATSALMSAFFAELGKSAHPAQALQTAKRSIRAQAKWSDPFFWAGFVSSGS